MFIFKEGERAYLTAWEFNTCKMLGKLADIVEAHGGNVHRAHNIMATYQVKQDMEPVPIWGCGYISFELGGIIYKFNVDDNPFFDHMYAKTPLVGNMYSQNVYYADISGGWTMQGLTSCKCSEELIAEAAGILFQKLIDAPMSERYKDVRKEYIVWEV